MTYHDAGAKSADLQANVPKRPSRHQQDVPRRPSPYTQIARRGWDIRPNPLVNTAFSRLGTG